MNEFHEDEERPYYNNYVHVDEDSLHFNSLNQILLNLNYLRSSIRMGIPPEETMRHIDSLILGVTNTIQLYQLEEIKREGN